MANVEETAVGVPVVVKPVEVELTPVVVVPQSLDKLLQIDLGTRLFRSFVDPCHRPSIPLGVEFYFASSMCKHGIPSIFSF